MNQELTPEEIEKILKYFKFEKYEQDIHVSDYFYQRVFCYPNCDTWNKFAYTNGYEVEPAEYKVEIDGKEYTVNYGDWEDIKILAIPIRKEPTELAKAFPAIWGYIYSKYTSKQVYLTIGADCKDEEGMVRWCITQVESSVPADIVNKDWPLDGGQDVVGDFCVRSRVVRVADKLHVEFWYWKCK